MNCSAGMLHYLGEVEAVDRAAALAQPEFMALPQHLLFTFEQESLELPDLNTAAIVEAAEAAAPDVRKATPPSGSYCRGVSFIIHDARGEVITYRRCGWDGELGAPQDDDTPCQSCSRLCVTQDLGIVNCIPATAAYAWLPNYNIWQLCPLP